MQLGSYLEHLPPKIALRNDHITETSPLRAFAVSDALLAALSKDKLNTDVALYFWPGEPMVYLGMVDSRLPKLNMGLRFLQAAGYRPVLRPSGGLAVVSEGGILNFSLMLRPKANIERLEIDDAYQLMADLINLTLAPFGEQVSTGEVSTSYCPGTYDLSLHGRKIAGIAQRRIGRAVGIYIYLSLSGNQAKRGALIRDFYNLSGAWDIPKPPYPKIDPSSMANIGDFIPALADCDTFIEHLLTALKNHTRASYIDLALDPLAYDSALAKLQEKNRKLKQSSPLA